MRKIDARVTTTSPRRASTPKFIEEEIMDGTNKI